ncbi:hypothetical protein [Thermococcus sp.]
MDRDELSEKKSVEISEDELGRILRISLDDDRIVEIQIWKDKTIRLSISIGSEVVWIDEVIKGKEYSICGTDSSGGYSAGTFHVWKDSTIFVPADIPEEGVKRGLFSDENINILVWKCTPEFREYQQEILREEDRLDIRFPNEIYGEPYGNSLAYCLYYDYCGEPCKTGKARKLKGDIYEYWTVLMLLELIKKKSPQINIPNPVIPN